MQLFGGIAGSIATIVLLEGCTPRVGVCGEKEGDGIVFSIFSCAVPWHVLPLQDIVVSKEGARSRGQPPECKLSAAPEESRPLSRWAYGTVPDGFRLEACAPLVPRQTYEVQVHAIGFVDRHFTLQDDGMLTWDPRHACW